MCTDDNIDHLVFHKTRTDLPKMAACYTASNKTVQEIADASLLMCANCAAEQTMHEKKATGVAATIRYRKRMLELREQLGNMCSVCGHTGIASLHFHHKGPKSAEINRLVGANRRDATIKQEVSQTVLLCANCHMDEHAK